MDYTVVGEECRYDELLCDRGGEQDRMGYSTLSKGRSPDRMSFTAVQEE
jgi:hypothetical protein